MKSWRTTLGGFLTGIGPALMQSPSKLIWWLGVTCMTFGPILLGTAAQDSSNTKPEAKHEP